MTIDELIATAGSVGQLAKIAGVDHSTISAAWRRPRFKLPIERAWAIHEALGIPLHELRPDVWRPVNNETPAHNSSEIVD